MDRDDAILNYLQGRMTPTDRDRFEAAMADDPPLAAEVEVMRAVRAELAEGPRHENADAVWARLSTAIDPPARAANQNRIRWSQIARYAAVALLAVSIWEVGVAPLLVDAPDVYRAATESDGGFALQVRFADDATMAEITAALVALNGVIEDGPSAIGLVRVSFADETRRREALDALRARDDLVDFVQVP